MPSLPLDFSVQLNIRTQQIVITDTSAYAGGVANSVQGIVSITQPDGVPLNGVWALPDITYVGSALTTATKELRLTSTHTLQQGTYRIQYDAQASGYTLTTLVKSFTVSYSASTLIITPLFDVFTPLLKVQDDTNYNVGGFNAPTVSRAWNVVVGSVTTLSGSSQLQDLIYSGHYYDALYGITLTTDLTYVHSTYTYLTITDRLVSTLNTQINTPPSFPTLTGYLKTLKATVDAETNFSAEDNLKEDYAYANSLLNHIKNRICSGDLVGVGTQLQDFLNVYHGHVAVPYVNTNAIIAAYDYSTVGCPTNTPVPPYLLAIQPSDITNWNTAFALIAPPPIEMIVGTTPGAPTVGTNTWQNNGFAGRSVKSFFRNRQPQTTLNYDGYSYSKPTIADTMTITDVWQNGELLQVIL